LKQDAPLGTSSQEIISSCFSGIFAINRLEWALADLAAIYNRHPVVALYETVGPDAVSYILGHSEMKALVLGVKQVNTSYTVNFCMISSFDAIDMFYLPNNRNDNKLNILKLPAILQALRTKKLTNLKFLVVMDEVSESQKEDFKAHDVQLHTLSDVEKLVCHFLLVLIFTNNHVMDLVACYKLLIFQQKKC